MSSGQSVSATGNQMPHAYESVTNLLKLDSRSNFDLNDKSLQPNLGPNDRL